MNMQPSFTLLATFLSDAVALGGPGGGEGRGPAATQPSQSAFESGRFQWRASAPLLGPDTTAPDPHVSIKDPTIVYHDGRWHLFATLQFAIAFADRDRARSACLR